MWRPYRCFSSLFVPSTQHPNTPSEALKSHRSQVEDILKRRFFVRPSFEIYDGVSGLYDYGPPGCSVKRALEAFWRRHFVLEEGMMELECSNLTPEVCLKASGHVDRFSDFLVKESSQGNHEARSFRADKLIEDFFQTKLSDPSLSPQEKQVIQSLNPASMSAAQLHQVITDYNIKSPLTNLPLTYPEPFNLMFSTSIGPTKRLQAFLRPETAQGIFVNFKNLYEQNGGKLPFAAAQIGTGFRNEISPRDGLLRVREFTMAEIEHFIHPNDKKHFKFHTVKNTKINFFSQKDQQNGLNHREISLENALNSGVISSESLGYYLARTLIFLQNCGISSDSIRFRQHLPTEMAHYAKECWDAEVFTTYGWVECVGIADRHCFDVKQHAIFSKKNLFAAEKVEKKTEKVTVLKVNKAKIGGIFKELTQEIIQKIEQFSDLEKTAIIKELAETEKIVLKIGEKEVILTKEMLTPVETAVTTTQSLFYPSVIEPSFGISRILYAIFEHVLRKRTEPGRYFLHFPHNLAPIKCSILPLSGSEKFEPLIWELRRSLLEMDMSTEIDDSSVSIGRRYARTDEIGIPWACTIDFASLTDQSVTLRELGSMRQVRLPLSAVSQEVFKLTKGHQVWSELERRYPGVIRPESR